MQREAQQQHKLGRELMLPVLHGTRPGAGVCEEGSLRWLGWSWPRGAVPAAPSATWQGSWCPGAVLARALALSQPLAVNMRISHPLSGLQEATRPTVMSHPIPAQEPARGAGGRQLRGAKSDPGREAALSAPGLLSL